MENNDLKIIKKRYGETFAHLCRELFPTLLETEGLLPKILEAHFAKNKFLGQDIIEQKQKMDFRSFVYMFVEEDEKSMTTSNKTPEELFEEAGYTLYPECKSEADIQKFRKYYYREDGKTPTYVPGKQPRE